MSDLKVPDKVRGFWGFRALISVAVPKASSALIIWKDPYLSVGDCLDWFDENMKRRGLVKVRSINNCEDDVLIQFETDFGTCEVPAGAKPGDVLCLAGTWGGNKMEQLGINPAQVHPQERLDERGPFSRRLDNRARGAQEVEDRLRELQAKLTLTEGERAEFHLLLNRRWP